MGVAEYKDRGVDVAVNSFHSVSDEDENQRQDRRQSYKISGPVKKIGAIQRWTPTALVLSYFVFSIALYTILDDYSRKVFWFLYLSIATVVAGTTALEAYDGLTPLREARDTVAKADNASWKFKTSDDDLPLLNLVFDLGDDFVLDDFRTLTQLPNELTYPSHKVVVNILRMAGEPSVSAAVDYVGDGQSSNSRIITVPMYATGSLSARVGYCLALDAPNAATSITAIFSGAQRPHPHAVRYAVERLLLDKKVDVVQGRSILIPHGGFAALLASLDYDMFNALLYPGRTLTWGLSYASNTNSYWRTDTLHAAVTASGTVSGDGLDIGFTALARKARTAHDVKVISYVSGPPTLVELWKLQLRTARELSIATARYSGLAFVRHKSEKADAGSKWTFKTRFAILWTLPIMRLVSHAILQYFCMAWAILFTKAPSSTSDFARTIYFPYPISEWLMIGG